MAKKNKMHQVVVAPQPVKESKWIAPRNEEYFKGRVAIASSNKAGSHDNRPPRLRTRATIKDNAKREWA